MREQRERAYQRTAAALLRKMGPVAEPERHKVRAGRIAEATASRNLDTTVNGGTPVHAGCSPTGGFYTCAEGVPVSQDQDGRIAMRTYATAAVDAHDKEGSYSVYVLNDSQHANIQLTKARVCFDV